MRQIAALFALVLALLATLSVATPALAQGPAGSDPQPELMPQRAASAELPEAGPAQPKPRTRDLVIFWSFGGLVIIGAIAVITRKNPVVAVMCLVGTFIATLGWEAFTWQTIGLLIGGLLAAPFGAVLVKRMAARTLMVAVGILLIVTSAAAIVSYFW